MKSPKLLTIIILLILPLSIVCQDIKPHQDGFIITRQFAELTAARFDSLKFYKAQNEKLLSSADTCLGLLNYAETLNAQLKAQNNILFEQSIIQNKIINSYTITEQMNLGLKKEVRKETRKKKAWKAAAITGLSLFSVSLVWIAVH